MRQFKSKTALLIGTVDKLRGDRYGGWSRLRFLCHPREVHDVCVSVRQALPFANGWSDAQILWPYLRHLLCASRVRNRS